MKYNFLIKTCFLLLTIGFIISCDKDYNEIGSDIVGDQHFGLNTEYSDLIAYNEATGPVQTNNLPINSLGYLNNSIFGTTTASYVTQLELGTLAPTFYDLPGVVVDSVYLYVPYFSHITATDSDSGDNTYALDSVIGNSKIKLSIYRSGYYLRSFDESTNFQESQKYYSNQLPEVDAVKGQLLYQEPEFEFSNSEIKLLKNNESGEGTLKERLTPGIFVNFNAAMKAYFKQNILSASSASLVNNNAFKEYFRGLYFKTENVSADGTMARVDFSKGKIVIVYKDNTSATNGTKIRKTLQLNLAGNSVNLFQNSGFTSPAPDKINGDEEIYLKGGEGSMAVVSLFNGQANNTSVDLNKMRSEKWLINEASITFNVENDADIVQPNRIYLYDLQNKMPIVDYYYDISTNTIPKYNKSTLGGILLKDDGTIPKVGERGTKYKIRITNYLRNLVKNGLEGSTYRKGIDSTNVKLGLVVTEAIANATNAGINNPSFVYKGFNYTTGAEVDKLNKYIPVMSVVNPLGIRLYGSKSNVPVDKRIRLEIKYTKPD